MMGFFVTERLVLRKASVSDCGEIYKNVWSDGSLAKYMLWQPLVSLREAEERLKKVIEFQALNDAYFVCLRESGEVIGFAGVSPIAGEDAAFGDCGICIASAFQGRGLGKELLSALAFIVFDRLGGVKFHYSCFKENLASAALCESLGFSFVGRVRKVRRWDNLEYDSNEYELLKCDWKNDFAVEYREV